MSILSIFFIAIGLAMDCLSISIAQGVAVSHSKIPTPWAKVAVMALLFGFFQGAMPLITFFIGNSFAQTIDKYDHWIALVLLSALGINMIIESFKTTEGNDHATDANFSLTHLLVLAVATSIDALATGIIFVPVQHIIWQAVAIIAMVSLVFSIGGFFIGKTVGRHLKINVELFGGLILISIGVKIFLEHILS